MMVMHHPATRLPHLKSCMSNKFRLFDDPADLIRDFSDIRLISIEFYHGLFEHDFGSDAALFRFLEEQLGIDEFAEDRLQAQQRLLDLTPDYPWNFQHDQIYQSLRADPDVELNLLAATLAPPPHLRQLLDFAKERGIPVIGACDGPLPSAFWETLLAKHHIEGVEKIYTSCEMGISKQKYWMFRRILADRDLQPAQMFHLGPDEYNDVGVPRDIGIHYAQTDPVARRLAMDSPQFGVAATLLTECGTTVCHLVRRAMERAFFPSLSAPATPGSLLEISRAVIQSGPLLVGFCDWITGWLRYAQCRRLFICAPTDSAFTRIGPLLIRHELPDVETVVIPPDRVADFAMMLRDADANDAAIVSIDPTGASAGRLIARNPHLALRPALHFSLSDSSRNGLRDQCYLQRNGLPQARMQAEQQAAAAIAAIFNAEADEDNAPFLAAGRFAVEWTKLKSTYGDGFIIPRAVVVMLLALGGENFDNLPQ